MVFPNVFGPPTMVAAGVDFKDRLVTLFDSDCDDGVSAGIWVIHTYFTKYLFYQTLHQVRLGRSAFETLWDADASKKPMSSFCLNCL